jgi:hypothetical protein
MTQLRVTGGKKAKVIETTFQIFQRSVDTDLTVQTHNPGWRNKLTCHTWRWLIDGCFINDWIM